MGHCQHSLLGYFTLFEYRKDFQGASTYCFREKFNDRKPRRCKVSNLTAVTLTWTARCHLFTFVFQDQFGGLGKATEKFAHICNEISSWFYICCSLFAIWSFLVRSSFQMAGWRPGLYIIYLRSISIFFLSQIMKCHLLCWKKLHFIWNTWVIVQSFLNMCNF